MTWIFPGYNRLCSDSTNATHLVDPTRVWFKLQMFGNVLVSRSLTNPWNPGPSPRSDAAEKRGIGTTMLVSRSLSHVDMADPTPLRSDALLKRKLFAKNFVQKHKSISKKVAKKKRAITGPLADLEYFEYYRYTPPTPLKTSTKGVLLYEVDRVLGKIVCECGTVRWLVKWQGYPNTDNSCISKLPEEFQSEWA